MINVGYINHLKKNVKWYPKKRFWEEAKYIMQTLLNENTSHNGNDIQNREIGNTRDDYKGYGKYNIDIIRRMHQKLFGYGIHPG